MKKYIIIGLFSILFLNINGQNTVDNQITVDKIWEDYEFYGKRVSGLNFMNDGRHYTRKEKQIINKYDIKTGELVAEIFNGHNYKDKQGFDGKVNNYEFSQDESKILIKTATEQIYRHSTRAKFYVFDIPTKEFTLIFDGNKIRYCSFSNDGSKLAFVYDNNLFYTIIKDNTTVQITNDGLQNSIINGATDWVYEEEFSFAKAFQWSPDGKHIAYLRFDESDVKEFTYVDYEDEDYPVYKTFKYPKVGAKNAVVTAHIYSLTIDKSIDVNLDGAEEYYIPRIKWTNNPNELCVFKLNRHQNHLQLFKVNAESGKLSLLMEEKNKYYIDIHDNLTFLDNGNEFIWTSEKSGYNHIYLYNMNGRELRALTKGDFEVTDFYGYDSKNKKIYYQAAKNNAMNREVYETSISELRNTNILSNSEGANDAQFSSTYDYFVNRHSTINSTTSYIVYDRTGREIRVIEDNNGIRLLQKQYNVQPVEFMTITTRSNVELNAWMIKPPNFDKNKKYPVFMYLYGGPGSQQVINRWRGMNYWWFQMLAQKGYIVACVDNRGTGGRGEEFKKMTYMQLGNLETIDQIESAIYLGELPFVDKSRIGIFGWSYGGYMSSLCILKGNDVFKAAIAVAPVTNWKWYDSVYTERFMRTERENPDGYKDNSPVYFADQLKGNYLLIHGLSDDNVHFQNSAEMSKQLIAAKKQFDTYYYPNRNHGIYGNHARQHLYTKMTNFVLEKL